MKSPDLKWPDGRPFDATERLAWEAGWEANAADAQRAIAKWQQTAVDAMKAKADIAEAIKTIDEKARGMQVCINNALAVVSVMDCDRCNGIGEKMSFSGSYVRFNDCKECHGTGKKQTT